MSDLDDFQKTLKAVVASQRRPQPKLTNAEIMQIVDAARVYFEAYEQQIADLQASVPQNGPAWYGFANDGSEYTGEQKQEILHEWMQQNSISDEKLLLRATLGERGEGPRARGPVTFYTYPSPDGIVALWTARSDNLPLLKSMVSVTTPQNEEEEEE